MLSGSPEIVITLDGEAIFVIIGMWRLLKCRETSECGGVETPRGHHTVMTETIMCFIHSTQIGCYFRKVWFC